MRSLLFTKQREAAIGRTTLGGIAVTKTLAADKAETLHGACAAGTSASFSSRHRYGIKCSGGWVIEIKLHSNGVGGTLPAALANLDYLQELDLSSNLLIGSIPSAFVNAPSLTYLNLGSNRLQGAIPQFGQNNTGITNLYLGSNKFTGTIPSAFFNLQTLSELDLRYISSRFFCFFSRDCYSDR